MDQIEIFDIPSPCQRVCETAKKGYCTECYRSREERFNWLKFSNAQKKNVLRLCKNREAARRRYLIQQQKLAQTETATDQLDLNF